MKICFIANLYPPLAFGGATGVAQMEAEYLAKKGHETVVITTSPKKRGYNEKINEVRIYRVPPHNIYTVYDNFKNQNKRHFFSKIIWHAIDIFNYKLKNEVKKIIEKENPDIIHIHNFGGLSTLIFKEIKKMDIPIIFTAHDHHILCPRSNMLRSNGTLCKNKPLICFLYTYIKKFFLDDKIDVVISPSKFLLNKFKENGLFKENKLIKLPNPIKVDLTSKPHKFYEKLEILYVGELIEHKGPDILIKSFKNTNNKRLRLHIVGRGPLEKELKKLAGKDKRIIFHGFLHGKKLMDMYRIANITVVPSILYDNSPMVVYESFMCSTPVIGSKIGGIPELIKDGHNGFLFEPGNVDELTNILNEILENPTTLKRLEKGARESSKKYDIKKHITILEKIYKSLIEEGRG